MRAFSRLAITASAVTLTLALAGCAARFTPSVIKRDTKEIFPSETTFDLVEDGRGGCKKTNGPYVFLGSSGGSVAWKVTNRCGKDTTVHIDKFKLKHRFLGNGPNPFSKPPQPTRVPSGAADVRIEAQVRTSDTVGSDVKGVNVYKYRVRIVTADGTPNEEDPELILDWP